MLRRLILPAALAVPTVLVLASCAGAPSESGEEDAGISIVASTNVWGSIAESIAGGDVEVTSIIDSPDQDPHEYEATSRDQLALSRADLVIENGGGYDPFIDTLIEASGSDPVVINAVDVSGLVEGDGHEHEHDHEHEEGAEEAQASPEATDGAAAEAEHSEEEHSEEEHSEEEGHEGHGHIEGFNEHVWYDLHTAEEVAREIAHELGEIDPDGAAGYEERLEAFLGELEPVIERAHELHDQLEGRKVAVTEPVPVWLFTELGLENVSPDEFTEAVEEDNDVPPAALQEVLDLLAAGDVSMLAYNEQTATSQTERVREAAEAADVPVVDFTETLPEGSDYVSWMDDNVQRTADALGV